MIPRANSALDLAHVGPSVTGPNRSKGEHTSEHVRIATYGIRDGTFQELADIAHKGMLRAFQEQPGFIRYGLADLGEKKCVSLSLWETHKEADAAVPVAEHWVRENIANRVEFRTTQIGDLAFFEGTLARV